MIITDPSGALNACLLGVLIATAAHANNLPAEGRAPGEPEEIKAYCLDFNWAPTNRRGKPFAKPGRWAEADPAKHVAWYKAIGANVIQTFCVSTNGYAWYKGGFVPEQPGLKHDFLPEVVKLGHREGMKVMGYFCIAANPRWAEMHPDLSYGSPTTYHIPYTDEYLDFLSKSIRDAVARTGIDGFMVDWVWMPKRDSTGGKWLDCEKTLYRQLMGEPFPGEGKLDKTRDTEYSRRAIGRCWKTIREAAKEANPECIVWLTVNHMHHPHVVDSDMYKEADWLMNEAGSVDAIRKVEGMVGEHTRLITCLAVWNGQDASKTVPEALSAGVGLYGFTTPRGNDGLVPLDKIFVRQATELSGDDKNIAVLARAYHDMSEYARWDGGAFVEPDNPPPFRLGLQRRGRGFQDTATISHGDDGTVITVTSPYGKGRGQLTLTGDVWPSRLIIRLQRRPGETTAATVFRMAGEKLGFIVQPDGDGTVSSGSVKEGLDLGRPLGDDFLANTGAALKIDARKTGDFIEVVVPGEITRDAGQMLGFEWGQP